tara:strand:- start:3807 stop:4274 length:468 start_codon:yes stop_codon:yes gene_type:complete
MIRLPDTHPIVIKNILSHIQCQELINQLPEMNKIRKAKGKLLPGKWSENFINTQRIRLEEQTEDWLRGLLGIKNVSNNMYVCFYKKGDMCKSHVDPVQYTVLLTLNDNYNGGELTVQGDKIELNTGDCVVFKGDTKHEVSEIIDGVRWSLSVWFF